MLQLPYVQNRLFVKLLQYVSHTTQFTITHQKFQYKWLHHVSLTGLTIKDPQHTTMLAVDHLALRVNPLQLLINTDTTLQKVCITGAQVCLCKEAEEEDYSINVLLHRLVRSTRAAPTNQHTASFMIEHLLLQDVALSMNDQKVASPRNALGTQHFTMHQIDAELANLTIQDSTLAVDIRHLTGQHIDQPLSINRCSTSLVVAPDRIQCQALYLQTGGSTLQGSCTVTYDPSMPPAAVFNDHVHMTAHLHHAVVATEELAVFVPYFEQHKTSYTLGGTLEGAINDLQIKDFQIGFGEQGSYCQGCLRLQGLPDTQAALFNMELQQSVLHTEDLLPYLDAARYEQIAPFHLVATQGHFYGTLDDFIVTATFDTDLGKVTTDLELKVDPADRHTTYQGAITTCDFELGTWLNNATVQQLTMQGQIDGKGSSLDTAQCQLEAHIGKLGLNHYDYENIYANGQFAHAFFKGKLAVDDPHLKLQADTTIDLSSHTESVVVQGRLDKACLQPLRLTDRPATVRTQLAVTVQGLSWDSIKADVQLHQLVFGLSGEEIQLDTLHIRTDQGYFGRLLALDSALLSLKAEGNFSYASLLGDVDQFIRGYQRRLTHAVLPTQPYTLQPYTLTYQLYCKDINPLLCIVNIDAYVSPNTQLKGSFSQQEGTIVSQHHVEAGSLAFQQNKWNHTQLDLYARQSKDGQEISAIVQLASKQQQWGTLNTTEDLALDISWNNHLINFSSSLGKQGGRGQLHIQGQAAVLDDTIEIVLTPPQGTLYDHQWHVHPENRITIGQSWMQFQNFVVANAQQQVSLVGILSDDPDKALYLTIKELSLDNLNLLVHHQLTGVLNATAAFQGTMRQPHMDSKIALKKLTVDNFLVGDIYAQTSWHHAWEQWHLACQVHDVQQQTVDIQGFYAPRQAENSLQLTANFVHAPLAVLAPLVTDTLSQLAGELDGTLYIKGSPALPHVTGGASMTDVIVRINDLNVLYKMYGDVIFEDQTMHITTLNVSDDQQGTAVLQGSIVHQDFSDLNIDLRGSLMNFRLLNTTAKDNEDFYGTGILSGRVTASGSSNNIDVRLTTKTAPGTCIYIPMHGSSNTVAHATFVRFVDFKAQYQDSASKARHVAFPWLKLTLILDITPDAYTELILDTNKGGAIKGRGRGNIQLTIDTAGDLRMAGDFEFVEGTYQFDFYQIGNTIFKIMPKSKISWSDSPGDGILNVQAVYTLRASLAPLLEDINLVEDGATRQLCPVEVGVNLQGVLSSLTQEFTFKFTETPGDQASQAAIRSFQQKAASDPQYAAAQAKSLLILQSFYTTSAVGEDVVVNRLNMLASRQLNRLANALLDNNLEVSTDIDLTALRNNVSQGLRVNLTYQLTDRLQVSRQGNIGTDRNNTWRTAQLVGDWTIVYVLTNDGSLRAKLYNKYLTNPVYSGTDDATMFSGGVSLVYVKSFDRWKKLLKGRRGDTTKKP